MPYASLHLGPDLRLFGQLVGAWSASVEPAPGPVDETGADLLQGFAQAKLPGADGDLTLQGGRQLLAYGSERLIGLRFGPNVPQAFDGALARWEAGPWRVDAFLMRPVENGLGSFDDRTDGSRKVWSLYATRALPAIGPASGLDLFYIGYDRTVARFEQGTGRETRHTVGARFFGRSGPGTGTWRATSRSAASPAAISWPGRRRRTCATPSPACPSRHSWACGRTRSAATATRTTGGSARSTPCSRGASTSARPG
jgi:hypothetical protein